MKPIKWPPEIDAIKFERESILARVKNTDIWIDLSTIDMESLERFLPQELEAIYNAWRSSQ